MPIVKPGRVALWVPQYHPSGLLKIDQGTVHGIEISYDPDYNSFCLHGEYGVVLYRFDVTRESARRNVVSQALRIKNR